MAALTDILVRRVRPADAAAISALYRPYVETSRITFELDPPDPSEIAARIAKVAGRYPWIVAERDGALCGYAYATAFRDRPAYRFAVETSIYLAPHAQGCGLGRRLYEPLLAILTEQGFVHAIGAITLPNPASVALHERLGFVPVGSYPRVGFKLGAWAGVGLYQKALSALPESPQEPAALADSALWSAIGR